MKRILIWTLLFSSFLVAPTWAVLPLQVESELKVPESPLPFGKSAELVLTLKWDEKLKFTPPKPEDLQLGDLVILDAFTTTPASTAGDKILQYHLLFTTFRPGKVDIDPVVFSTSLGEVASRELSLEFVGAKKDKDDKLEKLRPPKETVSLSTATFWRTWLARLAGSLALLGLLFAILSHFGIFEAFLSPKRRALKKLKRLHVAKTEPRTILIQLLEIHRDYLSAAYGLKTREVGSAEILSQIDEEPRCRHLKALTEKLIVPADLAKFAAKDVDGATASHLLELTQQTIRAESRQRK